MNELGFMIMDVMRQLDTVLMDGTQEFASIYPLDHRAKMLTFKKNLKTFFVCCSLSKSDLASLEHGSDTVCL